LDILVVDDGSTDETALLLARLGVRWLRFPQRLGIGSAMRAGIRYATRLGYDAAVRMDGDGQHRAGDIEQLLEPLTDGRADVVLGSRYTESNIDRPGVGGFVQRVLGACLSALTGRRVTDATSGFCALSRRALDVLAEHHPTGYPEAELRLFLNRNALTAIEVPVRGRSRLRGRTSLTPGRVTSAGARIILAMLIVPLRGRVQGGRP
jgi:glycosyltransferase involved in cell wall biosynthesis